MTASEKRNEASQPSRETPLQVIDLVTHRRIIAFKDWVYFRKTHTPHVLDGDGNIVLHLSDNYAEGPEVEPAWNELIGFGPDCKYFRTEDIGGTCLLPVMHTRMFRLGSMNQICETDVIANEDWAIKEDALIAFAPFICLNEK